MNARPYSAPAPSAPLDARVRVPGSKSLANRELVLSALSSGPSVIRRPLRARDTALMIEALSALGAEVEDVRVGDSDEWRVRPVRSMRGGVQIDCGLAGTVMRFVPPIAALASGPVTFDGDEAARKRPMGPVLDALEQLGIIIDRGEGASDSLPFTVHGQGCVAGGELRIDASASSQFVSGLLLSAPRFHDGLTLHHTGERLPSTPHIDMTLHALRERGVEARAIDERTWRVEPGEINGASITLEPDLSNAEPFLIAPIICGGRVSIPDWPTSTTQVGDDLRRILPRFGATIEHLSNGDLVCSVERGIIDGQRVEGVDLDLSHGGELAPNLATLCALCASPSRITGIGHLRGHETDRIAALAAELTRLGASVRELDDGLEIIPIPAGGVAGHREEIAWRAYADHRMATSGAIAGLAVADVQVDDIACTSKTMPNFTELWAGMLGGAQ